MEGGEKEANPRKKRRFPKSQEDRQYVLSLTVHVRCTGGGKGTCNLNRNPRHITSIASGKEDHDMSTAECEK